MGTIIRILLTWLLFTGFLFAMTQIFKDFKVKKQGFFIVGLILLVINWGLGWLLHALAFIPNVITLGIFSIIINWIINVIILWVTDKFSDQMNIGKTSTLLIAGAIFSLTQWLAQHVGL